MESTNSTVPEADMTSSNDQVARESTINGMNPSTRRLACDFCRERKVRCDRSLPKCGRCARLDCPCSYKGRAKHLSSQARQIAQLQERLAQTESRLGMKSSSSLSRRRNSMLVSSAALDSRFAIASDLGYPNDEGIDELPLGGTPAMDVTMAAPIQALHTSDSLPNELCPQPNFPNVGSFEMKTPTNESGASGSSYEELLNFWDQETMSTNSYFSAQPSTGMVSADQFTSNGPGKHFHLSQSSPMVVDEDVSLRDLNTLHRIFFEFFSKVMPIVYAKRFYSEMSRNPLSPSQMSLSYSIALVATSISRQHAHLRKLLYRLSRQQIDLCESSEESNLANFNVFQALVFITRYELITGGLTRVWITLGRATRMAKMMRLDRMDQVACTTTPMAPELQLLLPPTRDLIELEERRRTFWTLYILDVHAWSRTRVPCSINADEVTTALPSIGELDDSFIQQPMPSLTLASSIYGTKQISSLAGVVLNVKSARNVFDHIWQNQASKGPGCEVKNVAGFWDRHYTLLKGIDTLHEVLQDHINARAFSQDPIAFTLYLNLLSQEICLHEAAIDQVLEHDLPALTAADSFRRSDAAALRLAATVRMCWPAERNEHDLFSLTSTFIAWPFVMAIKALRRAIEGRGRTSPGTVGGTGMNTFWTNLQLLVDALDEVEEANGPWHVSLTLTGVEEVGRLK